MYASGLVAIAAFVLPDAFRPLQPYITHLLAGFWAGRNPVTAPPPRTLAEEARHGGLDRICRCATPEAEG